MSKQRKRKARPVCKTHWQQMRKEALAVMPFWSRPLAGFKINRVFRDKGFLKSESECTYCDSGSNEKGEN